jgi:hypothetical protein
MILDLDDEETRALLNLVVEAIAKSSAETYRTAGSSPRRLPARGARRGSRYRFHSCLEAALRRAG